MSPGSKEKPLQNFKKNLSKFLRKISLNCKKKHSRLLGEFFSDLSKNISDLNLLKLPRATLSTLDRNLYRFFLEISPQTWEDFLLNVGSRYKTIRRYKKFKLCENNSMYGWHFKYVPKIDVLVTRLSKNVHLRISSYYYVYRMVHNHKFYCYFIVFCAASPINVKTGTESTS